MSIFALDQFEKDLAEAQQERERELAATLRVPTSVVVRFGIMRMVGEYPYRGDTAPGCGTKLVVKTHRGHEIGEMLTSTCPNAGCSKSVSRQEMLDYIEASGGRDYPFYTDGRALRVATVEDMQRQTVVEAEREPIRRFAQELAVNANLPMRFVGADPIIGGERLTLYYTSEDRIDFRDLLAPLAEMYRTRIDLRQIGARDEARLVADYERCGQHCCCKQFLKVLKPVQMKAAKMQKASLDPLKISGRCGRLMCCLRYEQETYESLDKGLPRLRKVVGTPHGVGIVVDRQVLTQLVLVEIEATRQRIAVPVEELMSPEEAQAAMAEAAERDRAERERFAAERREAVRAIEKSKRERPRRRRPEGDNGPGRPAGEAAPTTDPGPRTKRRRPKREGPRDASPQKGGGQPPSPQDRPDEPKQQPGQGSGGQSRRRRRQRFGGSGGSSGGGGGGGGGGGAA